MEYAVGIIGAVLGLCGIIVTANANVKMKRLELERNEQEKLRQVERINAENAETNAKALCDGVQCLLRAEIIRSHDKYMERKKIPIYGKEAVDRAYKAYHALGGNDVATALHAECMQLPVD